PFPSAFSPHGLLRVRSSQDHMKAWTFSLSVLVLAATPILAQNGRPPLNSYAAQSASAIKVSPEFQREVSQLASTGLRLKEAVEASLDGVSHHLAAIFQRDKPSAPNEAYELRVVESDGVSSK